MRVDDTPLHVSGLEKYVELEQEQDFLGRAALARLAEEGVDRKLVGIGIGGEPMTDEGALNDFWPVTRRAVTRPSAASRPARGRRAWSENIGLRLGAGLPAGARHRARGPLEHGAPRGHRARAPLLGPREAGPRWLVSRREVVERPGSVSFDRAAEFYDATRRPSPEGVEDAIGVLEGHLPEGEPLLEVGVGTGALAVPLAARRSERSWASTSRGRCSRKLLEKAGGDRAPFLVVADATRLPFASGDVRRRLLPLGAAPDRRLGRPPSPSSAGSSARAGVVVDPGGYSGEWRVGLAADLTSSGRFAEPVGLDITQGRVAPRRRVRGRRGPSSLGTAAVDGAVEAPCAVLRRGARRVTRGPGASTDEDLDRAVAAVAGVGRGSLWRPGRSRSCRSGRTDVEGAIGRAVPS